jgi:hypothetical protein
MAKEFFASAKFRMGIPGGLTGVAGGLIIPSGLPKHTLQRRNLVSAYPHLRRRLLDPQLYLATLAAGSCRKACANLASYGWFPGKPLPKYESSKETQAEWKRRAMARITSSWLGAVPTDAAEVGQAIRVGVETQTQLGCEAVILPSPLTTDPATDYATELMWLDVGLDIARRIALGQSRIATVAISDTCLRGVEPAKNGLLDVIVDQVTARRPEGAYIVIEQANEYGYYCTHPNTVGSLLRLVHGLKIGGATRVIVGFAGMTGLLALAVGADAWSTGWYRGERRLRLSDFEQDQGRAVPAYYSQPLAGEFHVESDLDRATAAGFLPRLADVTPASRGLIAALTRGAKVKVVPEWLYSSSNVSASIEHFINVAARETAVLADLDDQGCVDYAQRWLEAADRLASDLYRIGSFNSRTSLNHQHGWNQALQEFLKTR